MADNDEVESARSRTRRTRGRQDGAPADRERRPTAAPKHSAADLEAVFDVPVTVSAVLGNPRWK